MAEFQITKRWGRKENQSLQIVGVTDFYQLRKVGVAGKVQKIGVAEFEITKRQGHRESRALQTVGVTGFSQLRKVGVAGRCDKKTG